MDFLEERDRKNIKRCKRKSEKKLMNKKCGSLTSTETSVYTTKVLSRQCTETLEKSLDGNPAHSRMSKVKTSLYNRASLSKKNSP